MTTIQDVNSGHMGARHVLNLFDMTTIQDKH